MLTPPVERLVYLTKFYDIQTYPYWAKEEVGNDDAADIPLNSDSTSDSDSDQDEAARHDRLLRRAVREHPHRAWEEIAKIIGVDEEKFLRFYERPSGAALGLPPRLRAAKRPPSSGRAGGDGEDDVGAKRLREMLIDLIDTRVQRSPTSDPSERVGYGPHSSEVRAREEVERIMKNRYQLIDIQRHSSDSPTEPLGSVGVCLRKSRWRVKSRPV